MKYHLQAKDREEPWEAWASWCWFDNPREALVVYERYKLLYSKQFRKLIE